MRYVRQALSKWYNIGIQLGVSSIDLEVIEETSESTNLLREVLVKWEANPRSDKPFTWKTVLDALRSEKVKEHELADEIEETLTMS